MKVFQRPKKGAVAESTHDPALARYAGSANLNASELPLPKGKNPTEKIYRRLGDLEESQHTPNGT